jgi:hypothetical protein
MATLQNALELASGLLWIPLHAIAPGLGTVNEISRNVRVKGVESWPCGMWSGRSFYVSPRTRAYETATLASASTTRPATSGAPMRP